MRNIYKLYRLHIFLREGHLFLLCVLKGEATLWHKPYIFFAVDTRTNKCTVVNVLIGPKPNIFSKVIELVGGGSPIGCVLVGRKAQLRRK